MADAPVYLLGLDAGNTVIKAVLFDLTGRQIAMSAMDGQSSQPAPGFVERDLDELWSNARQVIRDCLKQSGTDPRQIAAIGCAGHGNGLYLTDAAGAPLLGIQSLDTRAAAMAAEFAPQDDALHALCLQKPWPAQTPMLLAWVKRHRPEIYARAATLCMSKDFINFRLTGERTGDISDMSGAGLLRMPDCVYDRGLMALYGLEDAFAKLPRLVDPAEIAGHVTGTAAEQTGLAAGTPVIGGYFDVIASAMGSGSVAPGSASIIAGTWGINQVFSEAPATHPDVFMVSGFGPERFVNIESSATSAANLEWYVRGFVERGGHHEDPFGFCNDRVASVNPAWDDPFFHPYLYGSGQGAEFRAGFYGVAGWHGEGHLLRALFEGVMFEHRRHIGVLRAAGLPLENATLSGGGSRSPVWPQMFADGLNLPISVATARETGALGAAIGAAVGVGLFADYEAGRMAMTSVARTYLPDPKQVEFYNERYARFLDLSERMHGFWQATPPARGQLSGDAP
ncbi:FGGY-family carbohydrate kinase [Pseudogemmobacter bohemicus]|uniref:FGGY-family carbohydrate kinase n=1 Tax=Pseudogemmobacter bohemicus TaxID=2250708 RepID=UPI000DD31946|nr:FGGY-family carbohydrate kinase [Pseudogemmobacter bohemicus]